MPVALWSNYLICRLKPPGSQKLDDLIGIKTVFYGSVTMVACSRCLLSIDNDPIESVNERFYIA